MCQKRLFFSFLGHPGGFSQARGLCLVPHSVLRSHTQVNQVSEAIRKKKSFFPKSRTPLLQDDLKYCKLLWERYVGPIQEYSVATMAADVLPHILKIWHRADAKLIELPIRIDDDKIARRISCKWQLLMNIAGKKKDSMKQKLTFESGLDNLFSILVCECDFVSCLEAMCAVESCHEVHINCHCSRASKIP